MEDITMLDPTAIHYVPTAQRSEPAPIETQMGIDVNVTSETSNLHLNGAVKTSLVGEQMEVDAADHVAEANNRSSASMAAAPGSISVDTQMNIGLNINADEIDNNPFVVRDLQTSPLPTDSFSNYTTSPAAKEATLAAFEPTSRASLEPDVFDTEPNDRTSSNATVTLNDTEATPIPTNIESAIVEPATLSDRSEDATANATATLNDTGTTLAPTDTEPDATEPASIESATTEPAAIESAITGFKTAVVKLDISSAPQSEVVNDTSVPGGSSKDVGPKDSSAEDIHMHDDFHHEQDVLQPTSPPEDTASAATSAQEAGQYENVDIEVQRLQATYDSSCDSASQSLDIERERERESEAKDHTLTGARESDTSPDVVNDDPIVTEPIEHSQVVPSSFPPTTEAHVETTEPVPVSGSLFGGPAGPLNVLVTAVGNREPDAVPEAEITSRIEPTTGFDLAAETKSTSISAPNAEIAEFMDDSSDPPGPPVLSTPELSPIADEFDWAAKFDAKSGVEMDTGVRGESDFLYAPPKTDEDAKPDMNDFSNNTSQVSQSVSYMELIDNRFEDMPLPPNGYVSDESDHVPDEFKAKPSQAESLPCICGDCRTCKWSLRHMKDDGYVSYPNHVPDTDKSENYEPPPDGPTRRKKQHKSQKRVVDVEVEDGEQDEEGDEEHTTTSDTTGSIDMFNDTIPYNRNDTFIREKNSDDEESASDGGVFHAKGKKRAKAGSSKPSRPAKRGKKDTNRASNSDEEGVMVTREVKREPQTIVQVLQRLAKAITTKLSYPMTFNSDITCNICSTPNFAVLGFGIRRIKIYDFGRGKGLQEIPDANDAGLPVPAKQKVAHTTLCMGCTTSRMQMLMCKKHALAPMDPLPNMDMNAAFGRLMNSQPPSEDDVWCSICLSPAIYTCCAETVMGRKGCGLEACETCAVKLSATHDGDLGAMLKYLEDEVTDEYRAGLRADAELLRKDGELMRHMIKASKGKGKGKGEAAA